MTPLDIVRLFPWHFDADFVRDLPKNLHVYERIKEKALGFAMRRNHYAIDNIVGDMRWNGNTHEEGGSFKLQNNFRAGYARVFHLQFPNHRIFKMRRTNTEKRNGVFPPL